MERKLATVVSHPRAGTHFLMNTLAENFGYISAPWIDFDAWGNMFAMETIINHYENMLKNPNIRRNTIKSHYEVHFYIHIFDVLFSATDFFYIYRDEDATLRSYRKHLLGRHKTVLVPRVKTDKEFENTEPVGELLRYQAYQYPTMRARVQAHIRDWLTIPTKEQRDRIIYVRYEDLNDHFEDVVGEIARRLGYPVPNVIKRPSKGAWHVN